jgi:hypothetical protein
LRFPRRFSKGNLMFFELLAGYAAPYATYLWGSLPLLILLLLWVQVPREISYYFHKDGSVGVPYDAEWVNREADMWGSLLLDRTIRGRLQVLRFCLDHDVPVRPLRTFLGKVLDLVLLILLIPTCVGGLRVDPKTKVLTHMVFSNTRPRILLICLRYWINPWGELGDRWAHRTEGSW